MRWWLDRGVDGFRMDVINLISKDPALPDGRRRGGGRCGDGVAVLHLRPAHPRVPAGDARARCSPAATAQLLTVGEMPGVTVDEARAVHRSGPPRARHGVPVRARRPRPRRAQQVGPAPAAAAPTLKASLGALAGRARRRGLEQPLLEQPRPAARGVPVRRRRRAPRALAPSCSATVLHLHRGTPYVYQGEELGMTNAPFAGDRGLPRHRVAQPLRARGRGRRRSRGGAGRAAGDAAATTRAPRCSGTPRRTPASPPARRGCRSTRTTSRSTPSRSVADPGSVFHHYRRLDRAAARRAGGGARRLHDAAARTHEPVYAFTRASADVELLVVANFSGEPMKVGAPGHRGLGSGGDGHQQPRGRPGRPVDRHARAVGVPGAPPVSRLRARRAGAPGAAPHRPRRTRADPSPRGRGRPGW